MVATEPLWVKPKPRLLTAPGWSVKPVLRYRLRRCGTLMSCEAISELRSTIWPFVPAPNWPAKWHPLQVWARSETTSKKNPWPRRALGTEDGPASPGIVRFRYSLGLGGCTSASTKSSNAAISLSGSWLERPSRLTNAGLKRSRFKRSARQ